MVQRVKLCTFMMSATIVAVGLEAIGQGVGADDRAAWQVQIGVTRVGSGGRVLPRCRNGRVATSVALVASTIEPQDFVVLPRRARKAAPLARAIVCLTIAVVASVEVARCGLFVLTAMRRVVEWAAAKLCALGARMIVAVRPDARRYCDCCCA